jgi:hypothetical protein
MAYIFRNWLASFRRALKEAANGIFGHPPSFGKGFSECADFRDRRNDHTISIFWEALVDDRVTILPRRPLSCPRD